MEKLSFVIPCYRSEHTIEKVVSDITALMGNRPEYDHEIIMVNDHSPDRVWDVIRRICETDRRAKGISLARNFGQHSALMAGYRICSGDYIVTIDDDGQTPVDQTFILLDALKDGDYDVVYGKYADRKDNDFRKLGTRMNNFMLEYLLGKPKDVHMTSYFVAKQFVIREMCSYQQAFPYIWGLVLRTTRNIGNAVIRHSERIEGTSGYTLTKLLSLWMNGFTAFSVKPLRLTAGAGVLFSGLGMIGLLYTVVYYFMHPTVQPGYTALMSVLLIIGGLVLLSLGLIGEYVGRIYMCINNTPQYVVRDRAGFESVGTEEIGSREERTE